MKSRLLGAVCACIVSAVVADSGYSAVVSYDELVDGDLVHTSNPQQITNVGTFGIGINTISGTTSLDATTDPWTTEWDSFRYTIPHEVRLSSAYVDFSFGGDLSSAGFYLWLKNESGSYTRFLSSPIVFSHLLVRHLTYFLFLQAQALDGFLKARAILQL